MKKPKTTYKFEMREMGNSRDKKLYKILRHRYIDDTYHSVKTMDKNIPLGVAKDRLHRYEHNLPIDK